MATKLNIVAMVATPKTAEDLKAILGGVEWIQLTLARINGALAIAPDKAPPDVLIYEIPNVTEQALQTLEVSLGNERDGLAIFVVGAVTSQDLMRRLMRIGVRDVLQSPLNRQEIWAPMEQIYQQKTQSAATVSPQRKTVVAFVGAKGGCGTTFLAVNTAVALAAHREAKVALLDLDIQFGNVAMLLDLKPQGTVMDVLRETERMDAVLLRALMTTHKSGLNVLASPGGMGATGEISPAAVQQLIRVAASVNDVVILDLPHLTDPWVVEAIREVDKLLIVTQNTLNAIRDTRHLLDFLAGQGLSSSSMEVINNRAMAKSPSASIEQMKKALRRDRVHRIRNDYGAAVSAEDRGIPLADSAPNALPALDISNLAAYIWSMHHQGHEAAPEKSSWIDKLVRRGRQESQRKS